MTSSLAHELQKSIRGKVSFREGDRALYATDASNYRQIPLGVVVPETTDDVVKTVEICRQFDVPILTRGAGTSLAGQGCNAAVILDFRSLNQILEIDPEKKIARVQPGVVLDDLRRAANKYGLTFGPDPATHDRCTIGGMIGNNACGVHSIGCGKTVENIEALEILTYEGTRFLVGKTDDKKFSEILSSHSRQSEIYNRLKDLRDRYLELIKTRYPKIPRRVSGYNLEELLSENGFHVARALVGTEGTCVTILEATLKLISNPAGRSLVLLGYPDIYTAGDHVAKILTFKPIGMEGLDEFFVNNMRKSGLHLQEAADLPEGKGWLMVEFGGAHQNEAEEKAHHFIEAIQQDPLRPSVRIFFTQEEQKRMWGLRESSFGATVFVPGEKDTFSGFEDSAVSPDKLGNYMRELRKLYDRYDYYAVTYGHFGDGCIHTRLSFDLKTGEGIQKYKRFLDEAADLVVRFGGSFSGEHGDGQTWGHLLHKMYGHEMVQAFREFKAIWDPQHRMNPGKVIDTSGPDAYLRLKKYSSIPQGNLHFSYKSPNVMLSASEGSEMLRFTQHENPRAANDTFARETERCIGIGKCLKTDQGIMCPSYMVTREERHSTRGRAHLLHEMMRGEIVGDGWRNEEVKEALDLCLACKGCKGECPVKVDVATYKAEFLSHYYEGKNRPLSAYLFGLINRWAEIGSRFPRVANFFTQVPGFSHFAKWIAGIAPQRSLPKLSSQTFRSWFDNQKVPGPFLGLGQKRDLVPSAVRPTVILWPDTFSNYFYPEIAKAAVEVLEYAGFEVKLPPENLCCGRPLYDSGMLRLAKEYLKNVLQALKPQLEAGIKIIGLEPSCIAVFRDELQNLFPYDEAAKKLSRHSFLFSEFLEQEAGKTAWPQIRKRALVQIHCHQKALIGTAADQSLYKKLGLDYRVLDSGCCGMAGSFGFEKKHYDVSVGAANRILMPEVVKADDETLILSDGFSCREQIHQLGNRRALHLAEVMSLAIKHEVERAANNL